MLDPAVLNAALTHTRDGVTIADARLPGMPLIYVNSAFERMTGYRAQDVLGRNCSFLQGDARDQPGIEVLRTALRCGESCLTTLRNYRRDGTLFYNEVSLSPVRAPNGELTHFIGVQKDITERVLAQEALQASHLQLTQALNLVGLAGHLVGVGTWAIEVHTGRSFVSDQLRTLMRWPKPQPASLERLLALCPDVVQGWFSRATSNQAGAQAENLPAWDFELMSHRADGSPVWLRTVGALVHCSDRIRLIGAVQDIDDYKQVEQRRLESHELLQTTLRSIGDAVITAAADRTITWLNPVAERLTGWSLTEAMGRRFSDVFRIVFEDTRLPSPDPIDACLREGQPVGLAANSVLIAQDGTERAVEDVASPIRTDAGEIKGAVMVFRDATVSRRLTREMTWRAKHDSLTGLINRSEFEVRLRQILESHQRPAHSVLLYIDLDRFKLVNDTCGHSAGDQLLRQIATLFTDNVRQQDIVARLGGDEFGIVLQGCDLKAATLICQTICNRVGAFIFEHDGRRFQVGASIGVVGIDDRWTSIEALIQAADAGCFAAKAAGRNRYHCWSEDDSKLKRRLGETNWAAHIETAIEKNELAICLQRIMPLSGGRRPHAEVLLRLRGPDGRLIAPSAFLPAAERYYLASRVDRWVVAHTLDALESLPGLHGVDRVAINLSGQSMGDRAFHRFVADRIARSNIDPRSLCFEITETSAISNLSDAARFIEDMHAIGVLIALDDFGTGVSSFAYLKSLPVDYLKIDGTFIQNLCVSALDEATVRCFRDVAHVMGIATIAEYVESDAVLDRLEALGIDYAQGYLLHRPEPFETARRWLVEPLCSDIAEPSRSSDGDGLGGAHLNGACLNGSSLSGASLNGSSLNGARLNGARLNGALQAM